MSIVHVHAHAHTRHARVHVRVLVRTGSASSARDGGAAQVAGFRYAGTAAK